MSYTTFPSKTNAGAPAATDDASKGFVVGSQWIDTSGSPRKVFICADATVGAASWIAAGGVSSHPSLTTLGWSASGHTGTQTSVACFDGSGNSLTVQATADGQVLQRVAGVLVFAAVTATIGLSTPEDKTLDVWYFPTNADLTAATASAANGPGSIV